MKIGLALRMGFQGQGLGLPDCVIGRVRVSGLVRRNGGICLRSQVRGPEQAVGAGVQRGGDEDQQKQCPAPAAPSAAVSFCHG